MMLTKGEMYLIGGIIILSIIAFLLFKTEKEIKKVFLLQNSGKNTKYMRKIERISSNISPEKNLILLDNIAKQFFQEAFGPAYKKDYSELANKFKNEKREECETFCKLITNIEYSPEKINQNKISELKKLLKAIIEKNKIPPETEKNKMQKIGKALKIKHSKH